MKILAVADQECRALGEHFDPARWQDTDLVLACGDLDQEYLGYLADRLNTRVLYIRGNHDSSFHSNPPLGCENIHGKLVNHRGIRIFGIEGSIWYNGHGVQYRERQIAFDMLRQRFKLWRSGGIDIVISHSPPRFCADAFSVCEQPVGDAAPCPFHDKADLVWKTCPESSDRAHWGFNTFHKMISRYQPSYWIHGHTHRSYGMAHRWKQIGNTVIGDAFEYLEFEIETSGEASS
jgi:Icc-related predicted phosphoesterase